jgi:DNA-binding response OmpR family regulator
MEKNQKCILIVDDDQNILDSLSSILRSNNYIVCTAQNGAEAIAKFETQSFNLVLLDIKLPDINGTELLNQMHRDTPEMMLIMITGFPSLDNAVKSLNLGADAYIMKPINPAELLKVIQEKLNEQEEAMKMSQENVEKWIKTRIRNLEQETS